MSTTAKTAQIKVTRMSPAYWRITFDNPPLNLMGPEFVLEFREIVTAVETDEQVRVLVFDSAVEGFFLNHSDFNAKLEDLTKHTARADRAGGVAGHPRAADACACRVDRPDPRSGDGERKRNRAGLRHEFREPGKSDSVAMGSGRGIGRRRRTHGSTAEAHGPESRLGSAAFVQRHPRRSGGGLRLCEPLAAGRRARRVCRSARDPHRFVRQMGDREHQAPGQRQQLAAGRRNGGRVGRLHGVARSTGGADRIKACSSRGFTSPETRKIASGFTWAA